MQYWSLSDQTNTDMESTSVMSTQEVVEDGNCVHGAVEVFSTTISSKGRSVSVDGGRWVRNAFSLKFDTVGLACYPRLCGLDLFATAGSLLAVSGPSSAY